MKRAKSNKTKSENPFAFSIGDLMAGILFIFVLLLSVTMLEIQEKAETDAEISGRYNNIKSNIYLDIAREFKDNLSAWNAVVDSTELSVRFSTNEGVDTKASYFVSGSSIPSDYYKKILTDFFPRFLEVVSNEAYRESIEEIRIEGHTDSDGGYLYNIQLSQNRAREVLDYCLSLVEDSVQYDEMVNWAKFKITANGLSYSRPIRNGDGTENKSLSRRVEFKVRTNAEKQLEEIAKIRK